jgi:poly-gamma-glutamate capsule biosynthesis protein CapA/YwtB (metallophosphatase superfamily)
VADNIHLIAGSAWSNKPCDYIATLAAAASHAQAGSMNILFPHWGFEIENYPRQGLVDQSQALLQSFSAIVGHHSHTPQLISAYRGDDGLVRPVAYSLGNFCCGTALSRYRYGQILKLELGRTAGGHWAAGRLRWKLLRSEHSADAVRLRLCTKY